MKVISRVYSALGLEISWDKTFVSQVMCQYLNRVFYDGVEVTPGAKAFLRIGKPAQCPIPTLPDEIANLSASVRGAIKSGSDHRVAFLAYCFEIHMLLRKWSNYAKGLGSNIYLPFMCYVPVGLGGFGISSLAGLSMNESFVSIQTGISNMKMICHKFNGYCPLANEILNAPVREMDAEAILRAPHSIRTSNRTLNMRRFANAAKAIITKTAVNPFFKSIVQAELHGVDDFAVMTIEASKVINEVKRQRLLKMSTISYVEKMVGKLQTSSTAALVVGHRRCAAILMVNKSEARTLISELMRGKLVRRDW